MSSKSIDCTFSSIISKFDIAFLSETHLSPSDSFDPKILGFTKCIRNDRITDNRRSGGVLVVVKPELQNRVSVYQNIPGQEQIFLCLDNSLIIGGVYIPPRPSIVDVDERFSILSNSIEEIQSNGLPLVLFGDFNSRIGNSVITFPDTERTVQRIRNRDRTKNRSGVMLRDIISRHFLYVLNGSVIPPSFTSFQSSGSSMIDIALCSRRISDCFVRGITHSENLYSDHCPISVDLLSVYDSITPSHDYTEKMTFDLKFSKRETKLMRRNPHKIIDLEIDINRNPVIERVYSALGWAIDNNICMPKETLSALMDDTVNSFKEILYEYVGYKSNSRHQNVTKRKDPWIDEECRTLSRKFRRLQKLHRLKSTPLSYNCLRNAKKQYKAVWKRKRSAYERQFLNSLFFEKEPRELWNTIQGSRKSLYNGSVSVDSFTKYLSDIAHGKFNCSPELLKTCKLLNKIRGTRVPSSSTMKSIVEHMESMGSELWELGSNKAPGSDGLTIELIRLAFSSMSFVFERFMICFYLSGETPHIWDCDVKVGILKPGKSGHQPSDLRPITLVNTVTKVYERFLLSLLKEFFSTSECQAGFKSGYSCVQRVFSITTLSRWSLEICKRNLFCIFIDFSSFFDTVQTDILIDYLYRNNVPPSLCRAIHGMFKHLKAKTRLHNKTGCSFDVKVGIRQGSVISPFLGAAYLQQISDALSRDTHSTPFCDNDEGHMFYADDLIIYSQDIDTLQRKVNTVFDICNKIGLNINTAKTFWTVFHRSSKVKGLKDIYVGNNKIVYEPTPKYLGVTISDKLCFKDHIKARSIKANRAFSVCINFRRRYPSIRFPLLLTVYERIVIPSLLYGSEICGWVLADELDHNFYLHMKRYFALPNQVSKNALYWSIGILPLHYCIWEKCYKFWIELLRLSSDRLEKSCYSLSKDMYRQNAKCWFSEMVCVFDKIGFEGNFVEWSHVEATQNFQHFRSKVKEYLLKRITDELGRSTSKYGFLLSVFPNFKKRLFLEFSTYEGSRVFLKTLLSVHKFEIETGRHDGTDRPMRFCLHCVKSRQWHIGDENHHIVDCSLHHFSRIACCEALSIQSSEIVKAFNGSMFLNASMFQRYSILTKYFANVLHEVTLKK